MRRLAALSGVLILLLSGSVAAVHPWRNGTVSADAENVLADLINDEHARACGKRLTRDGQLKWAARFKAQSMGYRDLLAHLFPDGSRIWDFYAEAGINFRYGAGENIGVNTFGDHESPRRIFEGWMASSGHRGLIRNCDYDHFNVGAFQTKGGVDLGLKWYAAEFTNTARP